MKKISLLTSIFTGFALFTSIAKADLVLSDVHIVSGYNEDGTPIFVENSDSYQISSETTELTFYVRLGALGRGLSVDPIVGTKIQVSGSPVLNFQAKSKTNGAAVNKTATFTGDYGEDFDTGLQYMIFTYTPSSSDYFKGVSMLTGGKAPITLGSTGVIETDEPSDGTLPASSTLQTIGSSFMSDFNANSVGVEINMFRIACDDAAVAVPVGSDLSVFVRRADEGNTAAMTLQFRSENTAVASVSPQSASMPLGSSVPVSVNLTGVSVGTTTLNISVVGKPEESLSIPVTVNKSGAASLLTFAPMPVIMGEGSSQQVQVTLGSPASADTTFTVSGGNAAELSFPGQFIVSAGSSVGFINMQALDGTALGTTYNLTVSDASGEYLSGSFPVTITNVPPTLVYPSTDSANPSTLNAVVNESITINASAIDPAGTYDNLTYTWALPDGSTRVGKTVTVSFGEPGGQTLVVTIDDGDGAQVVGYVAIEVEDAVTVVFTDEFPDRGKLPGWAECTFTILSPVGKVWNEEGNSFRPGSAIRVQANLTPGSYPLCWKRDSTDFVVGNNVLATPNGNTTISLNAPAEGVQTIYYIASLPFYPHETFGDIDQDGLSDGWESLYFASEGVEATSDNLMSLPLAISRGDYAGTGNPDGDRLPTDSTVEIDNVLLEGAKVEVFRYPLDFASGRQTYAVGEGKPAFTNLREYRGLREWRNEEDGWTFYNSEFARANEADRGNNPGTDPTLDDTDEDGYADGWEYYFWSTILYEVNSQNWRAYDPSFVLYDEEDPAISGIPLFNHATDEVFFETFTGTVADGVTSITGTLTEDNLPMNINTVSVLIGYEGDLADGGGTPVKVPVGTRTSTGGFYLACEYNGDLYSIGEINPATGEFTVSISDNLAFLGDLGDTIQISYETIRGLYSKEWLLERFDPMKSEISAPDTTPFEELGFDLKTLWDIASDIDNDGLTMEEEYLLGTDPLHWDTDRDGMPDGWEVMRGLEPLDPRNRINGCGPDDNPDGDYMAASEGYIHADAYIYDWQNCTYWNGAQSLPFNPTFGVTGGSPFSNLQEFLYARYLLLNNSLEEKDNGFVYTSAWTDYTTNPLDNDTNQDGLPDGWQAYVGYSPITGRYENFDIYLRKYGLPPVTPGDEDEDKLTLKQEFDNATTVAPPGTAPVEWKGQQIYAKIVTVGNGTSTNGASQAVIRYFPWDSTNRIFTAWTNKLLPTDPYNADTDGDGLVDSQEYEETSPAEDYNGDGDKLANFNPCSVDTNHNFLPDMFEYLGGIYNPTNWPKGVSKDDPYGPFGDPDGDGLPNYQEYLTGTVYGWRFDHFYRMDNEELFMPNPAIVNPEDPSNSYPYGASIAFRHYQPVDFILPKVNPVVYRKQIDLLRKLERDNGFDETISPAIANDNGVDNPTPQEIIQRVYEILENEEHALNLEIEDQVELQSLKASAERYYFSYGRVPPTWDPNYWAIRDLDLPNYYMPGNYNSVGGYPSTMPRNVDTDNDGMEDYWEVFHGLNPLYGGTSFSVVGGSLPDSDRADNHPFGDGTTDNWIMSNDPRVNRVMQMTMFGPYPLSREPTHFLHPMAGYIAEAAHFDAHLRPWLTGDPYADPDHDGLSNHEESFNHLAADVLQHTDPSPYWLTDLSNPYSHANLYYATTGYENMWVWGFTLPALPPAYMFSFEQNEGFDTDNDNRNDVEETTSLNGNGKTDPLDVESPFSRKALYLNGNAAARTRNPFFHDRFTMTSFTVEFWVRCAQPYNGKTQTILHRPVFMPIDDMAGASYWGIRNTFLVQLDPEGHITAQVDNDATETVSSAQVVSAGRVVSNVWNHVAVTMDAANDRLTLYLNGEVSDSVATSLKPCIGVVYGAHYITSTQNTTNLVTEIQVKESTTNITSYSFSPAPIVIGGYDRNPWGVVSGEYDMDPWGSHAVLGNSQPDFDEDRFFVGWVDEVRIWDQVRSQSEILNAMQKRFTKNDIQAINQAKFAWKQDEYVKATSVTKFPQELLYHYTFDSLPDVVADPSRDTSIIPDYDILARPNGWSSIDLKNPIPDIPWWGTARDRSSVYGPVYDYVPVIENTVAHMPQRPPLDIGSLRANYDTSTWEVLSYRYRNTDDWVLDAFNNLAVYAGSNTDILLSQVRNTMNPYGMAYYTANELPYSIDGRLYSGQLDLYSPYRNCPVASDMLPLRDAVGDIDVELWDGKGAGYENSTLDSDGDGLPDWWEIAHGLDPNDATGVNGAYGDFDGDGLDNYSEYRAGTSPNSADTDSDGYSDYYSRKDGQSLTFGELYDDADGMPNDWEVAHGLDPNRYDASEDLDSDGWTNLEEFYAGTLPNDARSYPTPKMRVTYLYNGHNKQSASLQLLTYAEKTAGKKMGGMYDARYFATPTPAATGVVHTGITGESGSGVVYHGRSYDVSYIPYSHIVKASLAFTDVNTIFPEARVTAVAPYDDEIGVFFEMTDESGNLSGVYLHYETGAILTYGKYYKNRPYAISGLEIGEYVYPVTFNNLYKSTDGTRGHVVSGPNRFIGFLDLNGDNVWNEGEPMGLSTALPTLVGWDTVDVTIPLTDTLFGYPRISWPASTNANNSAYTVEFTVPMAGSQTFKVEEPRTFFHEGDFRNAGKYGLNLGTGTDMAITYRVIDSYNSLVTNGSFRLNAGVNNRRKMVAKYPLDYTIVYNSSVELQWEMDWRNQGVVVTMKNDDTGETYISKQKYAFPVRNGLTTDSTYYYTLKPQELEGGAFVSLPAGRYSYTITELINTTGITPQSVSGRFQLVTSDEARAIYSISGTLKYFGKAQDLVESGLVLASGVTGTDCSGTNLPENFVPGTVSFLIKKNGTTIETLNDVNADGVLKPEAASYAYSGVINYKDHSWSIHFSEAPEAGTTIELATKKFSAPVYIQAFRLHDEASSSVSLSGTPVSQMTTYHKGAFKVEGLTAGAYTVRAFLDSNKNGVCDEWESQGFAVTSGSQSPILDSKAIPLIISDGNIIKTSLILHECDTDNDLLPDAWEYKMFGSITAKSGYDQNTPGVFIWQEYADGALDSDPRTPDTDLDGLTDAMEIMVTHTNTHEADTDADGISDLEEFLSGSDPLDASDAKPYQMPELAFDEDGVPYVDCTYPNLSIGVILNYELQRKQNLEDPVWMPVCDVSVGATDADVTYSVDGKTTCELPAGTIRMKPADSSDADFKSGFFRVKITADYGKMVDNGDGTCTYMTWVKKENNTWSFTEAATGKGTLIRDADGNWKFVTDAEGAASGTLIRNEDGSWSFVD